MATNQTPRMGYLYDTNPQSLLLGQNLNVILTNPANSNKKIVIEGYSFINQVSTFMMAKFMIGPTTNVPSGSKVAPLPYVVEPVLDTSNVGEFRFSITSGISPMSGGNQVLTLPLEPASRNYIESTPLTVMPGVTVGINISSTVAANLTVAIYTREESI